MKLPTRPMDTPKMVRRFSPEMDPSKIIKPVKRKGKATVKTQRKN